MSLIGIIIILVIVGLILYLINSLPIDQVIKNIIYILVVIVLLLWLLQLFGVLGPLNMRIGALLFPLGICVI